MASNCSASLSAFRNVFSYSNIICGEFLNRSALSTQIFAPKREFPEESDQVFYGKASSAPFISSGAEKSASRIYQQFDVFVDSIHFDHHNLWGPEEITVSKIRNLYFEQMLKVHHMAQIEQHHLEISPEEKSKLHEEILKNRHQLEKLWQDLQEIRKNQQFSATTLKYIPILEEDQEDWMKFGKCEENWPKAGRIQPKMEKDRITRLNRIEIQLILFFNEIEVARTDWMSFKPFLIPVMRRFEMEIYSKICNSLYFVVLERSGKRGGIREIGKAHIPLPNENDLEIALHEAVFECEQIFKPIGESLGTSTNLKENGRILCRAIMENGELKSSEERKISQILQNSGKKGEKRQKFELIPAELLLGNLDFDEELEEKKKLEEDDRLQKKYTQRSAIDAKRQASIEFAEMMRRRVINRRRQVEKKYEELVREQSIPTLSVALGQLFAPADESRRLKPMRREDRGREEGWNNTIVINIQSATNLPIRTDSATLQPFVLVIFGGKSVKTEVAIGRHPNWQFTSKIVLDEEDSRDEFIEVKIYDQIIEELDRDDRLHNVIHEQLTSRLLASTKIRFDSLTTVSKINSPVKLWLPNYISNYKMSAEPSFLKLLLSTQIASKYNNLDYRQSQHSTENAKILEKCRELQQSLRDQFPKRIYRPLVVDIHAKSVICCRYLRPINPPPIIMQESSKLQICQLSANIISTLPIISNSNGSHSDIWSTVDQLTTIGICGGIEEKSILLACWLMHFKIKIWILLGEKLGEKCGFVVAELENSQQKILIDPNDGFIFQNLHDSNCGFEKIWGAFDEKNYYANCQEYDNIQQISLNFTKTANWKPLLGPSDESLETIQPSIARYEKLSEDWILELRIGLEREIKLKFDESRTHSIPQWNLVASRQLREILENPRDPPEEKLARLKDAYRIQLFILDFAYLSIPDCISQVLATNLHLSPDKNAQFALSVNLLDYFSHILRAHIAIAILKPKK
ncbi:unnamed protein product [Caenorhabditis angaria]|uniref:C2 domain-containing protein n=1 Tax=Caenorhabditis angaria TaxID=860376 RepID=A0A9P1MX96_9PELO|nr:unnamed protein product [Caenorhabditis angaria]